MTKNFLCALGISALLFAGCSQTATDTNTANSGSSPTPAATAAEAPEPAFTLKLSEAEAIEFDPTVQKVDLRQDTKNSTLLLGNYSFELKPKSANSLEAVTEGQVRVHVGLKGGKDATFENPMPVGEYDASKTFVDVLTFKDGNEVRTNVEGEQGKIMITEVTETHISGNVDITGDGGAAIKGDFKAEIVK